MFRGRSFVGSRFRGRGAVSSEVEAVGSEVEMQ